MKQNYLAVKAFVYFGYNYHDPKEFIRYICEKTGKTWLEDHLSEKFDHIYDLYGSRAVMNYFFVELDVDLREALVEYACKVYYPRRLFKRQGRNRTAQQVNSKTFFSETGKWSLMFNPLKQKQL